MCIHTLYIFASCGHFIFSSRPRLRCSSHPCSINPDGNATSSCQIRAHPFHSRLLEQPCNSCEERKAREDVEREARLQSLMNVWMTDVTVAEAKWKVAYGLERGGMMQLELRNEAEAEVVRLPRRS